MAKSGCNFRLRTINPVECTTNTFLVLALLCTIINLLWYLYLLNLQVHDSLCTHTHTQKVHVLNLAPASNSNLNFSTVLASICTSTTTCNYYFEVHVHLDLNLVDCLWGCIDQRYQVQYCTKLFQISNFMCHIILASTNLVSTIFLKIY